LNDSRHDQARRFSQDRKEKAKMNLNAAPDKDLKVVAFFLATISLVALLTTNNACAPPDDVGAVCGNGIVEEGEQCEPPNGITCDESCQAITSEPPVCGNGIVEEGEQCEPPNGTTCDESCQTITTPEPPVCGNGIVEEGEDCDPPDGTTCDESCQTIASDEIGIYLNSLPSWSSFARQSPSSEAAPVADEEPESFEELVDDATYECTTTRYTVTDNPEKIVMYSPDVEILWPGALIQGLSHRQAEGPGSLLGLVIAERAPIRVSIPSLASDDNYREVANPNQANVAQAIGSMIGAATADELATPSSITFKQEVCHSEEEFALGMNVSGRYLGFSASAGADFSRSASETTVAAHFLEKMYEVVVEPPQTPGAFFGPDFTQEKLDEQIADERIGEDNLPVYVSNVTYGRMLMFTLTSTASEQEITAAINAAYSKLGTSVDVELDARHKEILQESRIQVTSLGGDAQATLDVIRSGDWRRYFTDSAPLSTASPLSYTFRNLGDGSIASVTETTEYDVKECSLVIPLPWIIAGLDVTAEMGSTQSGFEPLKDLSGASATGYINKNVSSYSLTPELACRDAICGDNEEPLYPASKVWISVKAIESNEASDQAITGIHLLTSDGAAEKADDLAQYGDHWMSEVNLNIDTCGSAISWEYGTGSWCDKVGCEEENTNVLFLHATRSPSEEKLKALVLGDVISIDTSNPSEERREHIWWAPQDVNDDGRVDTSDADAVLANVVWLSDGTGAPVNLNEGAQNYQTYESRLVGFHYCCVFYKIWDAPAQYLGYVRYQE
jgi:hypothetical protein